MSSLPHSTVKLIAENNNYQFELKSCNPDVEVTFRGPGQDYDQGRLEYVNYVGGIFGNTIDFDIFSFNDEPSIKDQNPVQLSISQIAPTEGKPIGNTAVLYGYFLEPEAGELNFYLNEEQSQYSNEGVSEYGKAGIPCIIDNDVLTIILE